MKLGIGSYALRWAIGTARFRPTRPLRAVDVLHKAAELEVGLVQYACNLPLDPLSNAELREVAAVASAKGIDLEVGTSGCRADRLLRFLEIAELLRAPLVRLVIDAADAHPSPSEAAAVLRSVAPAYAAAGVQIAIENHFLMTSPALIHLVGMVDHPAVGVCLDTANSVGCEEWPLETVRLLAPYAINLHLKDYVIKPDPNGVGVAVTGAPLGTGRQPVCEILEIVRRTGRDMNVILEQWLPLAATEAETLQNEWDWLALSVANARSQFGL